MCRHADAGVGPAGGGRATGRPAAGRFVPPGLDDDAPGAAAEATDAETWARWRHGQLKARQPRERQRECEAGRAEAAALAGTAPGACPGRSSTRCWGAAEAHETAQPAWFVQWLAQQAVPRLLGDRARPPAALGGQPGPHEEGVRLDRQPDPIGAPRCNAETLEGHRRTLTSPWRIPGGPRSGGPPVPTGARGAGRRGLRRRVHWVRSRRAGWRSSISSTSYRG